MHDLFFRGMNVLHHGVLKVTNGVLGRTAGGMPVLELTTVGRKSGLRRKVLLTSPHQVGDSLFVVASKGGADSHPDWFLNLRDEPSVEVALDGAPAVPMTARIVGEGERAELWPLVVERYAGYGRYQDSTDREIPLVMLEPA